MEVFGWHMPGMRNLADLRCLVCHREFYGDLTAGQALYTPMLLEKKSGVVHDQHGVAWFGDWLRDSYAERMAHPVSFAVEERLPITRPVVLLNCLDTLYGHSLLKLLNAEYYLAHEVDLVLIIPSFLAWMIPEGVAQVWIVGLPLARGIEWNDWLADEIHRRVEAFGAASLSLALSHPKPGEYNIERFTRVQPFPLDQWGQRLKRPTVTFMWRDDRTWHMPENDSSDGARWKLGRLPWRRSDLLSAQGQLVVALAEALRSEWPGLDFAIAGLSEMEKDDRLPTWIEDLRSPTIDDDQERRCCARYAASHVVIGVHGSNMLLPTAHAGSLVELIGPERWGNFTQDVLFREAQDCRETFFRYRFLPTQSPPVLLAQLVNLMLRGREGFRNLMHLGPTGDS
jgi:hypothetical protein